MARRIGGRGGGSDPGGGNGAAVIAGMALAIAVAANGGIIQGGSSPDGTVEPPAAQRLDTKRTDARKAAQRGDLSAAWRQLGMRALRNHAERYAECVGYSVGQVREFLTRTPCRRLDRMLFAVADAEGNTAVIAVAWVEFRGRSVAGEFLALNDKPGSGHITPMGGAVLDLADVRLTGQHYRSRQIRAVTVTAEAEPVTGRFDDEVLDTIAEVAVYTPRP